MRPPEPSWEVRVGDALERLREMPDESVQCCVTSPPYWGLRDYGEDGQIGLEETPEAYVERLVEVFGEVRRVLREDGTLWLNLGDSYANEGKGTATHNGTSGLAGLATQNQFPTRRRKWPEGLKRKDLVGIPWRVAFALQADGWWLRSDILWTKPNPMPESVRDRPTKAHEYVFLLAKAERYFYDDIAVREDDAGTDHPRNVLHRPEPSGGLMPPHKGIRRPDGRNGEGRNRRTVWEITTRPFPDSHFAVFPPELPEVCIRAGTSEEGCCPECGAPWERVVERTTMVVEPSPNREAAHAAGSGGGRRDTRGTMTRAPSSQTTGWQPTCDHHIGSIEASHRCATPVPCTVLDPFAGAGTTGLVSLRLRRSFIGIELSEEYATMARRRIRNDAPLFHTGWEITETKEAAMPGGGP